MVRFLSLLLLLLLAGCVSPPVSPISPQDSQDEPYLCITEEGYQMILKEGYNKGYEDCLEKNKYRMCQPDLSLCKPLWEDVEKLLKEDNSDTLAKTTTGGCVVRAVSLNNAAMERGLWMYVVLLMTDAMNNDHVIVAFPTQDKGVVYIEPANDQVVNCEIGYDYSLNFPQGFWNSPYYIKGRAIIK